MTLESDTRLARKRVLSSNGKIKWRGERRLRQMEGNHRAFRRKPEKRIRFRVDVQPVIAFTSSLPSRRVNIRRVSFPSCQLDRKRFRPLLTVPSLPREAEGTHENPRICSKYSPIFAPEISLSFQP